MFNSIILLLLLTIFITNTVVYSWRPCPELSAALRFPCRCNVELFGAKFQSAAIAMNCDFVVFQGESPPIPHGAPIISYSQRYSGQHTLPTQLFNIFDLPIGNVDFSHNYIRRLPEKIFSGIQDTLITLHLSDNLLGDSLNPIFSTSEFRILNVLRVLDLSGNKIKALEEGIFIGCENLQELYLDRNSFTAIPSLSLNGPTSLKTLSLAYNNIVHLNVETFNAQLNLEKIDLRYNRITTIDGGAFSGLIEPKEIYLAGNLLSRLNSDVFNGATPIQKIDLSENFITIFPTIALQELDNLKVLNLSSNMIQKLNSSNLDVLKSLQILDLSKNNIATVPPATFRDLKLLKYLDLSLNSLRTIEDDALEGLDSLQTLIIRDNNILLIPGSALGRLPRLSNLYLDFNRIAALSSEILGSIQPEEIKYMSLSRNVIRELPPGSFRMFQNLRYLDLSGNSLATVNSEIFVGLEMALIELRLTQNRITTIGGGGGGGIGVAGGNSMEFHKLKLLDLSENNIEDIPVNAFMDIKNLLYLNISNNMHLSPIPGQLLNALTKLKIIDLSNVGLKELPLELFEMNSNLEMIYLKENGLTEILEGSFTNLRNCSTIDLSYNNIMTIKSKSFVNLMNIRKLNLKGNQLNAFKGEFFNTGSGLEKLDISDNLITYLYPSSFRIHPRLQTIMAANNKLPVFSSELIISLQYLEYINLAGNQLKSIDELNFARLPRLRTLLLADNHLENLSEMAFHNSTQLQYIDLSENRLERIGERTFEGLVRLGTLNLERNNLTELPDTIFDRTKLQMLENIILAHNQFEMAPLKSIQKQYFFVDHVDLSYNRIKYIPLEDSTMVNIKNLDLSFNPLSEQTVSSILNEPKTVRSLNLAGTGIRELKTLETPFLAHLNVSHNEIQRINESVFERTTLLENLDLSNNQLDGFQALTKIWPLLINLKHLNLSYNPFTIIANGDFDQLPMLSTLTLTDLPECTRIEKGAFKNLPNLSKLNAYNYPRLGYLDVQGIVEYLPTLKALNIEIKDSTVGADQIQPAKHPRLNEIGLHGDRLRTISTGTLAGLKSKDLNVKLYNTSINAIPTALLLPVPRSSNLNLDIAGSKITVLPPQLLSALEDRRNSISLHGLDKNPIHCDCNARALRRWLPTSRMINLKCSSPEYLRNRRLIEVGDDELTCDPKKMTSTTVTTTTTSSTTVRTPSGISSVIDVTPHGVFPGTAIPPPGQRGILMRPIATQTVEPEIIWSMPPSTPPPSIKLKTKSPTLMNKSPNQRNNDDTLIIGIVCGVVAFIFILIIIICIIRLRMTGNDTNTYNRYASHNMAMNGMPVLPMGPGSIQVSYKGAAANQHMHNGNGGGGGNNGLTGPIHAIQTSNGTALYAVPPYATHSYATLPHKGMASSQHPSQTNLSQIRTTYSTMGRLPPTYHYQSQQQLQQQQQQQLQQHHQHQLQQSQQQQQSLNGQPYIIYSDEKGFR